MFGKQLTHIAQGIAIAAVIAAVAVPSAAAGTTTSCQTESWTTVTDDLGLSQLMPVSSGLCTAAEIPCTALAQTGWVSVNDDLGVPFLVPTSPTVAAAHGVCVLAQASSPAPASTIAKATITKSKYRGWVVVTDTTGSSRLVSRSDIRG
jgi:hypothetical protein